MNSYLRWGIQIHRFGVKANIDEFNVVKIDYQKTLDGLTKEEVVLDMAVDCPQPETIFTKDGHLYAKLTELAIHFAVGLAGLSDIPLINNYFFSKGSQQRFHEG